MPMKRLIPLVISALVLLTSCWLFNSRMGAVPPLGKFLNPFRGFWQNAEADQFASVSLSIPGLKEAVTVVYDSTMVPHVFAKNNADLYMAQGYLHARHRLWQMEFQTHAAAGRVAEIIGAGALSFDREQRRIGMVFGAENSWEKIQNDPEIKLAVEAYTKGANAYINTLTEAHLPLEYKLLDYRPEPWDELKVCLFLMNMAKTLCSGEDDFEMTNALALFGEETVKLLYPSREPNSDPVVDNPNGWNFTPVNTDSLPRAPTAELVYAKPLEKRPHGVGSNNWAVSGSKTATGSPILCSDPHLGLSLPSLWFTIHLNAPGVNTMGSSFPGAPCVIIGFNDSIAWGPTNAQRDLVDWYKIQFQDESKAAYLSDGEWKPTDKRVERIRIRGSVDFYDTIIFTHHGPVTYDDNFNEDKERNNFAYRWIAHDGANILRTFYELNRAYNHADYMSALNHFYFPAQNFAFAAVNGDIAMRVQGKYPVRKTGEGRYVLDGTKTSAEWQAFIPFDQNVMIKNPARGFVSSANQYPVDSTYPYYVHANHWEAYRNRRVNNVLSQMNNITPQMMMDLQNDNYNIEGEEYVPLLLEQMQGAELSPEEQRVIDLLAKWDFVNSAGSLAASYFEAWMEEAQTAIWDEMQSDTVSLAFPSEYMTWWLLKHKPDLSFYDHRKTTEKEDRKMIVQMAFKNMMERVDRWKEEKQREPEWAYFKDSYIRHLARLEPLSIHAINGGNSSTLNASRGNWGPSWRMVVSLEKSGVKAWGIYPGGQSGNPGSRYYDNQVAAWEAAKPYPLKFVGQQAELQPSTFFSVTLNPAQ